MPGLLVNGQEIPVEGLVIINPADRRRGGYPGAPPAPPP